VLLGPVIGVMADRFGARKVALCSVLLFGVFFMSFGLANGSPWVLYGSSLLVAVGGAGTLPITWSRAINSQFEFGKGMALGIAAAGSGLFGSLVKPLSAWLIDTCGWRLAYGILGLMPIVLVWPVAYFLFFDVAASERRPTGRQRPAQSAPVTGVSLTEAIRGWRLWALSAFVIGVAVSLGGALPNVEGILVWSGSRATDAVSLAQLIGVSLAIGRLGCGWLLDRFSASSIALFSLFPAAVALGLLSQPNWPLPIRALLIALLGAAAGLEADFMGFLAARYFGVRHYGAIYGTLYGLYGVCTGIGATMYGVAYDRSGSFGPVLMYAAVIPALAALIPLALGKYVYVRPRE
jgi:predicted MFS family arabinose efflux permease